jgi:hypothetical protein
MWPPVGGWECEPPAAAEEEEELLLLLLDVPDPDLVSCCSAFRPVCLLLRNLRTEVEDDDV